MFKAPYKVPMFRTEANLYKVKTLKNSNKLSYHSKKVMDGNRAH